MICPKCDSKLFCQTTNQLDKSNRIREYACVKCNVIYLSEEKLDHTIVRRKIQTRYKKRKK